MNIVFAYTHDPYSLFETVFAGMALVVIIFGGRKIFHQVHSNPEIPVSPSDSEEGEKL